MARKSSRNIRKDKLTARSKRDKRIHHQPPSVRTIMTRSQCAISGSVTHRLPVEVLYLILDRMSVLEISVFSMVSKEINKIIVDYVSTLTWKKKMISISFHPSTCPEQRSTIVHFRDLGLLFKRCTLLLPTKDRLKFIFGKISQIPCFMMDQCLSPHCIGFSSFGVFLQALIAGWDELECHRVFNFICDLTNLLHKVEAVITGKPGVKWYQELQIRLFCREVLLDPWLNQPESQFWLTLLLKPWPMVSQAHFLLILYGPLLPEGILSWQDLVEREVSNNALWDLAAAILLLSDKVDVKYQANHSMLTILEELTAIPQPWHVENVARLMVLCGSSICYTLLASKAVNGRLCEISRLIVYIVLVCEKDHFHMSWAVKLVQHICDVFGTTHDKINFFHQLETMFSQVIMELYEFSAGGNQFADREKLCVLLKSSSRFHTKLFHMLLK